MSQEQLIKVVAGATPVTDDEIHRLELREAESELLEEILVTSPIAESADTVRRPRPRSRTAMLRIGAALAGTAAAAALILGGKDPGGGGHDNIAFAAEWVRIAEANPRLLVTAPGWDVTRADEYAVDDGEMTFSDGEHELDVHWRPAAQYQGDVRDPSYAKPNEEIALLGRSATLIRYAGTTDFITLLPPEGDTYAEIRGDLGSRQAYLDVLGSLERTDVQTWLSAMPPSVVAPTDRRAVVAEIVDGLPVPPGLDLEELSRGATVSERYQLGAAVTGAIACGWFDSWIGAIAAGNQAQAQTAEDAMATARSWPILQEMRSQGGWSQVLWGYADAMQAGTLERTEYTAGLGCGRRR